MNKLIYLVIFSFFSTGIYAQMKDLVQYVNTLQGTDSHFGLSYGNTYPTTGMPYAMHTCRHRQERMVKAGNINIL